MSNIEKLEAVKIFEKKVIPLWKANLKDKGVKLPGLNAFNKNKTLTGGAAFMVYATMHIGKIIKGQDALAWVKSLGISITDEQCLRHLSTQQGFNARKRNGIMPNGEICKKGEYSLIDLENIYEGWSPKARENNLNNTSWNGLKTHYNNSCATCGATEGKPHQKNKTMLTKLEKGHKDPSLPLDETNIIPQCSLCNKAYKDNFMFDNNGYVKAINNPEVIKQSNIEVQQATFKILQEILGKV